MSTINTNDLRVQNAKNFVSSANSSEENTYLFVGRVTPWDNDETPPIPDNSIKEVYRTHQEMIALSRVNTTDVMHMIPLARWTSGVTYDMYRHDYSSSVNSFQGANNLYNSIYYVINQNNDVYVCLFNDANTQSTVEPQNTSNTPFFTSDGYQWLRLYKIDSYHIENRTTQNYMPILVNNENAKTPEGAVYTVVIDSPGDEFTRSPQGGGNQIRYYYCNIVGDGRGAVARISLNRGQVARVDVIRSGSEYTYATVDFVANRTYASLFDLDNNINGLDPRGDGTFLSTVIISPPGGWGTDLVKELGGTRIGVFSELDFNYDELLPNTTFRQVGLLHNPETEQDNPSTMIACKGVKVTDNDPSNLYKIGEEILQEVKEVDIQGNLIATHIAKGTVVGFDLSVGLLRYIQVPELHTDEDGVMYRFQNIESIIGSETGKVTSPDTTFMGFFKGSIFSEGYSVSEFQIYSGDITYLTNLSPVERQQTQTEKISLIITY